MQIDLYQSVYVRGKKQRKKVSVSLFKIDDDIVMQQEISDEIVVIEDSWYEIHLTGVADNIKDVVLFLNDDIIECEEKTNKESINDILFVFDNKREKQLFLMQYDIVRLGVKIEGEMYVTKYMLCLSSNISDYNFVTNMVKLLLDFDDETVTRWVFGREDKTRASFMKGAMIKNSYKSVESFHQLVNCILVGYQKNSVTFRNRSMSKFVSIKNKVSYRNVQKFGREEFAWLVENMNVLQEVNSEGVVRYGTQKYVPEYIKCDMSRKTTDIYENRMIVAFLYHVIKRTENVRKKFYKTIELEKKEFFRLKKCETDKNKAPILIIKGYQLKNADLILEKLSVDIKRLKKMYVSYSAIIPCKKIELNTMPRKTKVFQEIQHYREIYTLFIAWFEYGEMSLEREELLFKVKTIDKIYEYFCLIKILLMIKQHGFEMLKDEDSARFYQYNNLKIGNEINRDVANTYKFTNGVLKLTLYYQPIIYSSYEETANNISLYRLNGNSYYTPDFLIKCENGGRERYAVLDSKFSKRSSLNKYNVLEKLLFKYCISLDSKCGIYPAVSFMWLLQGRQDSTDIRYFNNSKLSNKYHPKVSYGIYTLNEIEDEMDDIWNELNRASIK